MNREQQKDSMPPAISDSRGCSSEPWQLGMFRKGLKKRLRLACLRKLLEPIAPHERCLLLTCGDNNGAMNYFLRASGGAWSWAELEDTCIEEMGALLGDPVDHVQQDRLPYADESFDRIVVIDVHEHVDDPRVISGEICRILKRGARLIVTTPNGDEGKLAVRLKNAVGMSRETYGHRRVGLTAAEIQSLMTQHGIRPLRTRSFSRFFTELLELTINFTYVKVLAKQQPQVHGHPKIAPATSEQLQSVKKSYRLYSIIFPAYWLISQLDWLLFFAEGYCVVVEGRRNA